MRVRIYQHRAVWGDSHLANYVIVGWTKLFNWNSEPWDHSEIGFERPDGDFTVYSSTSRGKWNGPRMILESELLTHPER